MGAPEAQAIKRGTSSPPLDLTSPGFSMVDSKSEPAAERASSRNRSNIAPAATKLSRSEETDILVPIIYLLGTSSSRNSAAART